MLEIICTKSPLLKKAEVHMHSARSKDAKSGRTPERLVDMAVKFTRLNALAITDHNDIAGSLIARDYARARNIALEIPPGSEISSQDGHIVGLYIKEDIEPNLSALETIQRIHRQGGLAIAPHPLYRRISGSSLGKDVLFAVANNKNPLVYWDGLEVYSAGAQDFARGFPNEEAIRLFYDYPGLFGAPLGSTDGHGFSMARAITTYEGTLEEAIRSKNTGVQVLSSAEFLEYQTNLLREYGADYKTHLEARKRLFIRHQNSRTLQPVEAVAVLASEQQSIDTSFMSPPELLRFSTIPNARKLSWAASRLALKLAYRNITGFPHELFSCLTIANLPDRNRLSGPPTIVNNPDLHYSLAHSGLIGFGAVSIEPVGVDLEKIAPRNLRTLRDIASQTEIASEDNELSNDELIAKIWALKEAAIKGTKIGISLKNLKINLSPKENPDLYTATAIYRGVEHSNWQEQIFRYEDYYLALATQASQILNRGIKWYQLP